ncbi:MAG TPA: PAS domain S-box protein, partial [Dehalococcoidia bacterium]|nr:PAS domain S-box protein [Dehalococcoidia bacterium]
MAKKSDRERDKTRLTTGYSEEQKLFEKGLPALERKYKRLVEGLNEGYFLVQDLKVVFANPRSAEIFGYRAEEVIGKPVQELLVNGAMEQTSKWHKMRLRGEDAPTQYEVTLPRKDGTRCKVEFGVRLTSYSSKPAVSVIVRDITERKHVIEKALRESEERYRDLVEGSPDVIWSLSTDGMLTSLNPAFEKITGWTCADWLGKPFTGIVHPDDIQTATERFQQVLHGETPPAFELRFISKSGDELIGELIATPQIKNDQVVGVFGFARDITEYRQAERALRESEARYRLLAENITDVIFIIDMNMQLTYISPSVTQQRGFSVEEAMALKPEEAMTATSLEATTKAFEEEMAIEKMEQKDLSRTRLMQVELYCKDSSIMWAEWKMSFLRDEDGNPVGILGISRDITGRKQVEEALQKAHDELDLRVEERAAELLQANEQLRQEIAERKRVEEDLRIKENAIENSINAIAISDIDGNITYVNQAGLRVWGGECKEELIGKPYWELLGQDDAVREVAKGMKESGCWEGELISRRKDGTEMQIQLLSSVVKDAQGNPVQTISSFVDVTERKKIEEQLQLAGRLAAVGELAAGVAHELSNPLAAVQGFAQLLASKKDLDESIRGDVETIHREAQRASRITSNLLSFARRHKPEKSLVSINEAIEKTLELNEYRMRVNNIEVQRDFDPNLPMTMADFYQMQEVFVNLLTNAEQAMTEAHGRGKLIVRTQKSGGVIRTTFVDDGPGIAEEDLKRVFDPFFTTKEAGKGTGLGLSICYGLVESHGGHI